jgi:hypothetical protein
MQGGLCDISVAMGVAMDDVIAPVVLQTKTRPSKRQFADVDGDAGDEPNSDELYGWIEDDEVATEGLLIDEASILDDMNGAGSRSDGNSEVHSKKVARITTNG